jgi:hypothetical protein
LKINSSENIEIDWLTSNEVLKVLKIKSCDLMHLRVEGKLEYKKKGNAFLYLKTSVSSTKNKAK